MAEIVSNTKRDSNRIQIRPIEPADNPFLADIIREVMRDFKLDRPGTGYDDPQLDNLYETYQAKNHLFLVAMQGDVVQGGAGIAPLKGSGGSTCELQRMYLQTSLRGTGTGRRLLTECLEFATNAGFSYCYLETMNGMDRAVKLYESFGFEKQCKRVGATGHSGCNTWYLKSL